MGIHTKQYQWFRREVYPVGSLFPLRGGASTVYPQIAFDNSTNMPGLRNDIANDTFKYLSLSSSFNSPAGVARFFRCISASLDRETYDPTLYFH
jgi:hypothetical protein